MQNLYVDTKYMMLKSMKAMAALLKKVHMVASDHGHDEKEILDTRLAPDMFSFERQVQIMSDNAKGALARLAGIAAPSMPDEEDNLLDLVARLEKTIAFVETITDEQLRDADDRKMVLPYYEDKYQTAIDYVRDFAVPNFYFHMVTAYAILRMKGYSIGKTDFIGSLNLQNL